MSTPTTAHFGLKFWLVWNPAGHSPTVAHATFASAKTEAARLAELHPGEVFHVVESIGSARKVSVEWVKAALTTPL